MKTSGTGTVLPPGMIAAKHGLTDGTAEVHIKALNPENGYDDEGKPRPGEHVMAECVYPGGFSREHQVKAVEDLLPRVINQLRGRYGVTEVTITKAPKELKAGEIIVMEVKNG